MILLWMKTIFLVGIFYMELCPMCKGIKSPSEVGRSELRSTSIVVTWSKRNSADSYKVKIVETGSGISMTMCSDPFFEAEQSPFTIDSSNFPSIQPRTKYDIGVCAVEGRSTSSPPKVLSNVETGPPAPINIQTSNEDPAALMVSWVDNDDVPQDGIHPVDGYKIIYKITESGAEQHKDTTTTNPPPTSITINNLSSNTDYIITVVSLTTKDDKTSDDSAPTTGTTLPDKSNPPSPSDGGTTATSIDLQWMETSEGSATKTYELAWTSVEGASGSKKEISETSTTVSSLQSNTDYTFTVAARNEAGLGQESNAMTFPTLPGKVQTVSIFDDEKTTTSIYIKWEEINEGSVSKTYKVTWTSGIGTKIEDEIYASSKNITGLQSNTEYRFTVSAGNIAGFGESSEEINSTTLLSQPTTLELTESTSSSSVSISWNEPDLGGGAESIQGYDVVCNPSGCNSTVAGTTAHVYDLASNTNHAITVVPFTMSGNVGASADPVTVTTLPGIPTFASNQQPKMTNKTITLVWGKPDGGDAITNYSVEYRVTVKTRNDYLTAAVINHTIGVSKYNYTIENLTPGQTYDLRIVASNIEGDGTPLLDTRGTIPDPVQDLQANQSAIDQEHQIDLSWTKPEGVGDDIQIMYTGSSDTSNPSIKVPFNNEIYALKVQPGNIYDITLTTHSGSLESSSNSVTLNSKPSLPEDIQLSSDSSAITVTWGALEGHADWIGVKLDDSIVIQTNPMKNSFEFSNLTYNTNYKIELYTAIELLSGNLDESDKYIGNIQTEPIHSGGGDVGLIVGLVIAAIVLVIIIVGGVFYYRRRKKRTLPPPPQHASVVISNEQAIYDSTPEDPRSKIVNLSEFKEYMTTMEAHSSTKFVEEFEALTPIGRDQSSHVGSHPENKSKNRYKNILPYDNNRVELDQINDDDLSSDYINASYIAGITDAHEYIATQGPLSKTKDDFWRLVWEQNCRNIVMVTQVLESGKIKTAKYWPSHLASDTSRDLTITTVLEEFDNDWCFRKFKVTKGHNERYISHFNFTSWPDHGVPKTTESLVKFVRFVRHTINDEDERSGPIVVHCSAGVGRTGTFIAMDCLLQQLQTNSYVDIFGIVYQMRMQRMFMVQAEKQYIFIHKMVQELIEHTYEISDGEEYLLYENISNYQSITPENPVYENVHLNK